MIQIFQNILKGALGSMMSQIILFCSMPIVARFYGVETMGVFSDYTAKLLLFLPFSLLSLDQAMIAEPQHKFKELKQLASGLLFVTITLMVSFKLIVYVLSGGLYFPLSYIAYFSISAYLLSRVNISQSEKTVESKFTQISIAEVSNAFTSSALKLMGSFCCVSIYSLLVANIAGYFVKLKILKTKRVKKVEFKIKNLSSSILKLKDYTIYQTLQKFLNVSSQSLPIIVVMALYGGVSAGLFAVTVRIVMFPMGLLGASIARVLLPAMRRLNENGGDLFKFTWTVTAVLAICSTIVCLLIFTVGIDIVVFAFGESWQDLEKLIKVMLPWLFFAFINSPSIQVMINLKKQQHSLVLNIISTVLRVTCIYMGYVLFNDFYVSIFLYSLAGALHNIIYVLIGHFCAFKSRVAV